MTKKPHYCHALCCKKTVPPRMLMCLKHWRKVPKGIQQEVWRTYRPGQETDKKPSLHYLATALSAIFAVADSEGVEYDPDAMIQDVAMRIADNTTEQIHKLIKQSRSDRT